MRFAVHKFYTESKALTDQIVPNRFSVCAAYGSRTRKTGALREDAGKLAKPEKPLKPPLHSSKGECGSRRRFRRPRASLQIIHDLPDFCKRFSIYSFFSSHITKTVAFDWAFTILSHHRVNKYAINERINATPDARHAPFGRGDKAEIAPARGKSVVPRLTDGRTDYIIGNDKNGNAVSDSEENERI